MKITDIYLKKLKLAKYNPRKISKKRMEDLKASLTKDKDFLEARPVIVNKREDGSHVVIGGNQRVKAAQELGWKTIPCKIFKIPLEQEKAWNIKDNSMYGEYTGDLTHLLEELDTGTLDDLIAKVGLSEEEILEHIRPETEIVEDEPPPIPAEPKSKRGEIYELGRHRIMCGDSTSKEDMEKLMGGVKADMVFTDPPYGINVVSKDGGSVGGSKPPTFSRIVSDAAPAFKGKKKKGGYDNVVVAPTYRMIVGDDKPFNPEFLLNLAPKQAIFGGNYFADKLPSSAGWIVWDKNGGREWHDTFADCELIWTNKEKHATINRTLWKGMVKEGESGRRYHPTQKPIKLLSDILKEFTKENQTVLDPFLGSGSTLIACEQTQRTCIGMEIDPHYLDVIIARWENLTNKKHKKIQ